MTTTAPNNKKQIKNTLFSVSEIIAIWEEAYKNEEKRIIESINKKKNRVALLEKKDLQNIPEKEAESTIYQINYLNSEINFLQGIIIYMENLKNQYLEVTSEILDTYKWQILELEIKLSTATERLEKLKKLYLELIKKHNPNFQPFAEEAKSGLRKFIEEREKAQKIEEGKQ
jgi:hypothetical protein